MLSLGHHGQHSMFLVPWDAPDSSSARRDGGCVCQRGALSNHLCYSFNERWQVAFFVSGNWDNFIRY